MINLTTYQYLELEKISSGAFYPLNSFMNKKDLESVVDNYCLKSGVFFPMPIFLDIEDEVKKDLRNKSCIDLYYKNIKVGLLIINDIFKVDKEKISKKVYGTKSLKHPGVNYFCNSNQWFVGGLVKLKKKIHFDKSIKELEPEQVKAIFKKKKWKTIVGFQTRNIPHFAHEYLQRIALEFVDALYINPLIGWKKKGDYTEKAISIGYQYFVKNYINSKRVCLNFLRTNMRYAGPRESLFHALIRRNYGCTHFIIGRDHAGVGNFYKKYAAHDLASIFKDQLGIKIMKLFGPFYCKICKGIVTEKTCNHYKKNSKNIFEISGTYIRDLIVNKKTIDDRFIRKEIIECVQKTKVFIE
tara:strand:- start:178 stop:1242 length:1065 start_codon:yes stop_codon:yes gene_type:complete